MRANRRRWVTAALLVLGADAALLAAAGFVLEASRQLHASAYGLVAAILDGAGSVFPTGFSNGIGAILGFLGAGWWQRALIGPAVANQAAAGFPALGGILAAPVYAAVRRMARGPAAPAMGGPGSPPHRVYVAARAPVMDSVEEPVTPRAVSAPW